jgi:hypothetical protein
MTAYYTTPITRASVAEVQAERVREGLRLNTPEEIATMFTITPVGRRMGLEPDQRHVDRARKVMAAPVRQ